MNNNKDLADFLDKWITDTQTAQKTLKDKGDFNQAFESVGMETAYLNVQKFLKLNKN